MVNYAWVNRFCFVYINLISYMIIWHCVAGQRGLKQWQLKLKHSLAQLIFYSTMSSEREKTVAAAWSAQRTKHQQNENLQSEGISSSRWLPVACQKFKWRNRTFKKTCHLIFFLEPMCQLSIKLKALSGGGTLSHPVRWWPGGATAATGKLCNWV